MKLSIWSVIRKIKQDRKRARERVEKAYREVESELAYQEALEDRARRAFTFGDMQDLMKVASKGIRVVIKTADGNTIHMQGEDPLEAYNKAVKSSLGGEFF